MVFKLKDVKLSTNHGDILLYQSDDGEVTVDVCLADDTIWLSLKQISELFRRDKSVISRHLRNIFKKGELDRDATVAKSATVQKGGRRVKSC